MGLPEAAASPSAAVSPSSSPSSTPDAPRPPDEGEEAQAPTTPRAKGGLVGRLRASVESPVH
jgi:hypothetical protein